MHQDFKQFENEMTKIKNKNLDSSYNIYFGLYQQLISKDSKKQPYTNFKPDFFDLIIVDECHRGSSSANSEWRKILEYFDSAIQLGMTATPREDEEVSTSLYFGEPVYTYSLKQGIEDGFLAPYYKKNIVFNVDQEGYVPEKGKKDIYGEEIEQKLYKQSDFDKTLGIEERTQQVAKKITEFLKKTDRYAKTIVFCVDTEHASRMATALVNENSDIVKNHKDYIMRITGNDKIGKSKLDYFIDLEEKFPTIVTTSKLLSTGVDCKTCKVIVLDREINSPTEFKQIIGRGTRLRPDYGKNYFTVIDFRNNFDKYHDPEFDGEPEFEGDKKNEELPIATINLDPNYDKNKKKHIINHEDVSIILEEDLSDNLEPENCFKYVKSIKEKILTRYSSLNKFMDEWNTSNKKKDFIIELEDYDIYLEDFHEMIKMNINNIEFNNKDELDEFNIFLSNLQKNYNLNEYDDFDLICCIAYNKKPITRKERVNHLKKENYLNKYDNIERNILEELLNKYIDNGINDLENLKILSNDPFRKYGSVKKIANEFGGKENLKKTIEDLKIKLYSLEYKGGLKYDFK